jgi:hypothetical protein
MCHVGLRNRRMPSRVCCGVAQAKRFAQRQIAKSFWRVRVFVRAAGRGCRNARPHSALIFGSRRLDGAIELVRRGFYNRISVS